MIGAVAGQVLLAGTAGTVGAVLFAVFVIHQRRTDSPTLDPELFALGNFRWGNAGMFVFSMSFSVSFNTPPVAVA